jgi:hypothetical protein
VRIARGGSQKVCHGDVSVDTLFIRPPVTSDLDLYVVISDDSPLRATDALTLINEAIYPFKTISTDIVASKKSRFDDRLSEYTIEREVATKGTLLYG